jgi:hypothetical protein
MEERDDGGEGERGGEGKGEDGEGELIDTRNPSSDPAFFSSFHFTRMECAVAVPLSSSLSLPFAPKISLSGSPSTTTMAAKQAPHN